MEPTYGLKPPDLPRVILRKELGRADAEAILGTGSLIRVRHGAYIEAESVATASWAQRERTALARCVAVIRASNERRVISHESAAMVHGARLWRTPELVHVIQDTRQGGRGTADVRRHAVDLPNSDVTRVQGLPVTTLERTVLDCARTLHPRDAMVVADSALRILGAPDIWRRAESELKMKDLRADLLQRLESGAARRGLVRARAVLSAATGFAESPGESVLRWIALSRGLGQPIAQFEVTTQRGRYFSDLGWRFARTLDNGAVHFIAVHAEFDGRVKYNTDGADSASDVVVREKLREDALREAGGIVLRFVTEDLQQPDAVARRLANAMPAQSLPRGMPGLYLPEPAAGIR